MATCREIRREVEAIATLAEPPSWVRDHLAACSACAGVLEAARVASGLLRASVVPSDPPEGFAERVEARLTTRPNRPAEESDLWRPAWGLVPTFAAILAVLLVLQQGTVEPEPTGLLPTESITFVEQLVLAPGELTPEMILQAVMEGNGQ